MPDFASFWFVSITRSAAIGALFMTLTETLSESELPSLSVDSIDSVSAPTYLLSPLYFSVASAALIWAWLPLSINEFEPLAPTLMAAPPAMSTSIMPWATLSCVLDKLPSASFTLTPVIAEDVSWLKVCALGTVFSSGTIETPSNSMRGSNAKIWGLAFFPQRLMSFKSPML